MRKQLHSYLLDSQMPSGPVAMELNAIMDNIGELIGEAQTRAEGADMAESTASLMRSRVREKTWRRRQLVMARAAKAKGSPREPVGNGRRT